MIVCKLRIQRGWSQEQLAALSGLSTRTIQRIEKGHKAGLESLKALAAVFEVQVSDLQQENIMQAEVTVSSEEQQAMKFVREKKAFYNHLVKYLIVVVGLLILNLYTNPSYIWAKWVALGWGVGVISHGMGVFEIGNLFGPKWEKKQIEKRLKRKL